MGKRGMCLSAPGSLEVRRNIKGEIYVLKADEGGRNKPFFTGYRPQVFIRTADTAVDMTLPVVVGQRFAIREGGKTVAAGVITELCEDSKEDIVEEEERAAKTKASA